MQILRLGRQLILIALLLFSTPLLAENLLFEDNFDTGMKPDWVMQGTANPVNGQLVSSGYLFAYVGDSYVVASNWDNYAVEFDLINIDASYFYGGFGVMLRKQGDTQNYMSLRFDSARKEIKGVIVKDETEQEIPGSTTSIDPDLVGHYRIEVNGNEYKVFHDSNLELTISDSTFSNGTVGLESTATYESQTFTIDNFKVTGEQIPAKNLLQNGSFEEGPDPGVFLPLNPESTVVTNWTVISSSVPEGGGGGIDYYGTGWRSSDGMRSLDLNGTPGVGGIFQDFPTTPGQEYAVSFDMAGHPSGLLQKMKVAAISLGNPDGFPAQESEFTFQSGIDPTNLGWQTQTWEFTAKTTQTRLQFESLQTDYRLGGPALDNVVVTTR